MEFFKQQIETILNNTTTPTKGATQEWPRQHPPFATYNLSPASELS